MSRFYVTRGTQEAQLNTPGTDPGCWEGITNKEQITKLQYDLPLIDDNLEVGRDDISIPSPWANVILFDSMINNTDKGFGRLQEKSLAEWRAILYLIITRDLLPFKVQFDSVSITNHSSISKAEAQFYDRMYKLRPLNGIFENSWSEFTFVKIDNIPIGIISDSNLVCSRYSYEENVATSNLIEYGFMNEDFEWIDPTENIKKDAVLSVYVANWLKCMNAYLSRNAEVSLNVTRKLSDLVGEFRNDLISSELNRKLAEDIDFITFETRYTDIPNNALDLIKSVQPVSINIDIPEVSQLIKIKTLGDDVYVLDFLSSSFRNIYNVNEAICKLPSDGTLLGISDFFCNQIALMENEYTGGVESDEKTVVNVDGKNYQIVLPIKEEILECIPSEYIREHLSVDTSEDCIEIGIEFYNIDNEKRTLRKRFYIEDYTYLQEIANDVVIWPYAQFRDENNRNESIWNEYYVYSNPTQLGNDDTYYEYRVKYSNTSWEQIHKCNWKKTANKQEEPVVYKLEKIPTYISVISTKFNEEINHGLFFLKKPQVFDVNKNRKCHIGVDFGTTSTVVFYKEDSMNATEEFIDFGVRPEMRGDFLSKNEKYIVSKFSNDLGNKFMNDVYPQRKSYPSLIEHKETGNDRFLRYEEPFKWGNIIYNQLNVSENGNTDIMRNMKWGKNQESQDAIESYLGQITKMTAYVLARKGIGSFEWRFSYPTSLSQRMYNRFKNTTQMMVEKLKNLNLNSVMKSESSYFPESIVSAKFYKDTDNYICMDIGGGSTDVSIWKGVYGDDKVENILQFSVEIASRKIFLNGLADLLIESDSNNQKNNFQSIFVDMLNRKDIPAQYIDDEINRIRERKKQSQLKKDEYQEFVCCIEPGVQAVGSELKEQISQANPENSFGFYRTIIIGLWGLLYYTALSVAQVKEQFQDDFVTLHFAGTGSKMYSWISGEYGFLMQQEFEKILNDVVCGDKDANKIRVVFEYSEEDLKTEASRGLLRMTTEDDKNSTANIVLRNCGTTVVRKNGSELTEDVVISEDENISENPYVRSFFSGDNEKHIAAIETRFNADDQDDPFVKFIENMNCTFFELESEKINLQKIDVAKLNKKIREVLEENKNNHTLTSAFITKLEALLGYMHDENM